MKKFYLASLLCFFFLNSFAQQSEKETSETFKLVEVWLDAQKDYEKLPGITAAVIEDQKVLWEGAFGEANMEDNVEAKPSTICSICSISKLFTSVAIMKLYDEGKLRLDDKISDILPDFDLEQQYKNSGPITIRSIMTHSSGLPRESAYAYWSAPDFTFPSREEIDSKLSEQETLYPASTYFQYSNLGLTLLGEVVAEVSGMPYEEYVKENILKPLGLMDTRTELPENLYGKQLAIGYSPLNRAGERERIKFFQANGVTPAAGFSSNVQDLGKFASWQFRLRDTSSTEILKPSTLKYMQQVHWTNPDWKLTWGLGFSVYKGENGDTWAGHGGSCPGYRTTLQLDLKNKRAFSVMINAGATNPNKYVKGINGLMVEVKKQQKKKEGEDSIKVNTAADLSEYTGFYNPSPWWNEEYVGQVNGKLVTLPLPSDSPGDDLTFYKHVSGDVFRRIRDNGELGETMEFERDQNGKITRYKTHGNFVKRINK